jgi:galacturonokinase
MTLHNNELDQVQNVRRQVVARFGVDPAEVRVVRSPYRVCPLGAHVDHQLGQVTAMALDQGVVLAYAPMTAARVRLASADFPGEVAFDLAEVPACVAGDWGNFARGAALALQARYSLCRGLVGVTSGRLAEGGLSSSAAVGVAYLIALEDVNGLDVSPEDNIDLDQAIENGYLGLRNGILDQAAILLSRQDQLLHLDCATRQHRRVAPGPDLAPFRLLIAFSGLRQALVSTDYNRRVDECQTAARALLDAVGRPHSDPRLGRITAAEYAAHARLLGGPPARRAAHFFGEVARVEQGVEAWQAGDLAAFGRLVTASGESSVVNYECGCPPLIDLFRLLVATPGVYGARFSGAGFRGCCLALVDADAAPAAAARVRAEYGQRHPQLAAAAAVLVCASGDGARIA